MTSVSRWVVCIGCVALAIASARVQLHADETGARVRSSHAYIRAMIDEATRRSATFRRLVATIEETDGIVYVEQGECRHNVRACLTLNVTPTTDFRFLRVIVDARQPDWDVMASIGHELQHAIEVLENTTLRSTELIILYYLREGLTMGDTFETAAAMRAGDAVKNEVVSFARKRW